MTAAHASKEMPDLLDYVRRSVTQVQLRMRNLTNYLESTQVK